MFAAFSVRNQDSYTPSKRGYKQRNRNRSHCVRARSSMMERPFVNIVEIHAESQVVTSKTAETLRKKACTSLQIASSDGTFNPQVFFRCLGEGSKEHCVLVGGELTSTQDILLE